MDPQFLRMSGKLAEAQLNRVVHRKQLERIYAEQFLTASGLGGGGELVAMERPDFRLRTASGHIGIEVTRLYRDAGSNGSPAAEQYGLLEDLCSEAQRLHRSRNPENLFASASPNSNIALTRRRIRGLASTLVDLVENWRLPVGTHRMIDFNDPPEDLLPEEIEEVSAIRLPGEGEPIWECSNAWWVGCTDQQMLQDTINRKAAILGGHAPKFDAYWILIVCDGNVGPSALEIHRGVTDELYDSSFDRAFVLDCYGRCTELRLCAMGKP